MDSTLWNIWKLYKCTAFLLVVFTPGSEQGVHEKRLLDDLFRRYNKLERPVANESDSLRVSFGMTIQQIIDVVWNDYSLRWNASNYGGVKSVRLPPNLIWKPDILMYNSADEDIDSTFPTNVVVSSNGDILWVPPGLFLSTCKIDITWFPFDDQLCTMKFGSWTYDSSGIDLQLQADEGDSSSFIPNGEWKLIAVPATRNVKQYECCPEQYVDVTFTVHIRRRMLYYLWNLVLPCFFLSGLSLMVFIMPPDSGEKVTCGFPAKRNVLSYECCPEEYIDITFTLHIRRRVLYYGVNLILPCVLISSMALLTFTLPSDAGEKVSLGVTILLSLTVFLLLVAETMPPTSDAVPLIGMYFACIMLMCSLSVVFTVLVLNYHHRTPDTHNMPKWVKKGICEWLAWALRMQRPGKDLKQRRVLNNTRMRDVELRERSSRSLLANVLDMEDDFRGNTVETRHNMSNSNHHYKHQANSGHKIERNSSTNSTPMYGMANHTSHYGNLCDTNNQQTIIFKDILCEIRFLTDKMRKDDDFDEQCNDWKFAALVIDRLCLWVFTAFTIVSTCAILFSAPHVFSD